MKKSIFLALLLLCTITTNVFAGHGTPGIKRQPAEENGLILTKQNIINRMEGKEDNFTPYFNWTGEDYFVLLNNSVLSYYAEQVTGEVKYFTQEQILSILRDSTVILSASQIDSCWRTCGLKKNQHGGSIFDWFKRVPRSVARGDAKTDEMFVCIFMKSLGGKPLPILSLNCGNGVRSICVQPIVFEQPKQPNKQPEEEEKVVYVEPEQIERKVEYEYFYEDVSPPDVSTFVVRREQQRSEQIVYVDQPQQTVYQNPPQNRLVYNYSGGGNNAGWGGGFQQPSNNYNQQSLAINQSANSSNINDNSNVFNNNTNVSYEGQQSPPNTSNPNNYTSGSPANTPGSNLVYVGPNGVPLSGNLGAPVGSSGSDNPGGPVGAPGSDNPGGRYTSNNGRNQQSMAPKVAFNSNNRNMPQQRMRPTAPQQRQSMRQNNAGIASRGGGGGSRSMGYR